MKKTLLSYYKFLVLLHEVESNHQLSRPLRTSDTLYRLHASTIFSEHRSWYLYGNLHREIMRKPIALPHIDLRITQNEKHFFQKDTLNGIAESDGLEPSRQLLDLAR